MHVNIKKIKEAKLSNIKIYKTIPSKNLTDIENIILQKKKYLDFNHHEYFNLQELLNSYRINNNEKIKQCISKILFLNMTNRF